MEIKAVIFDLDGTITRPFFDFDMIRREMGLSNNSVPVWEAMEQEDGTRRMEMEKILAYHENLGVERSELNEGAFETLEELRGRGLKTGVLTRNHRDNAVKVADKHGLRFDGYVGREDGPVKPDAFGVLHLCKKFEVAPCEAMMVGDYLFDLLSGKSAGAITVLLANHKDAEQFSEHADFMIDEIGQILEVIENGKIN